jgi:GT2 family glycosyltransferase
LESLAGQRYPFKDGVEVLIVDNNSTDNTLEVVEAFRKVLPIRYVWEGQQGLARARNRAVADCRGDILLFTDDDVLLGPDWLAAYRDAFQRFPDADYFGGRILPNWGNAKPRWLRDERLPLIDGVLVWFDHGVETRPTQTDEPPPFGASFAMRRRLFKKVGPFRVELGTGGAGFGRGEETEFLLRAKVAGATGVYVGEALCYHAIDRSRLTLVGLWRYGIASGRSYNAIATQPHRGRFAMAVWFVVKGSFQALKGRGDRFRQCIINAGIETGTRSPVVGGH